MQEQLAAGAGNASALWRELRAGGFAGGPRQVLRSDGSTPRVTLEENTPSRRRVFEGTPALAPLPAPKSLAWLLLRAPAALDAPATLAVARAEQDPEVARVAALTRDFVAMVAASGLGRRAEQPRLAPLVLLEGWLERAAACGVEALHTFAAGLCQDGAAGLSRLDPALEQRTGRGPDQPPQDAQASDVWARRLRSAAPSRAPGRLDFTQDAGEPRFQDQISGAKVGALPLVRNTGTRSLSGRCPECALSWCDD